jgi:hypothetical protein
LFKDSHTGKESISKTAFVISSLVVFVKVLTSGVVFGDFSGASVDFLGLAAVHAVFASAYYGRSKVKADVHSD